MNFKKKLLIGLSIFGLLMTAQAQNKNDAKGPKASLPKCAKEEDKDYSNPQISLNALVYDEQKMFVKGLSIKDFQVFEDGREQKILALEERVGPLRLGLVVDNSGSLRSQLGLVLGLGQLITKNLRPDDEVYLMRFISSEKIEVVKDWTTDKTGIQKALAGLYVEGGQSAVIDAVYLGSDKMTKPLSATPGQRRVLVLISDGDDKNSFYKRENLWHVIQEGQTQVLAAHLWKELEENERKKSEELLQQMAFVSAGRIFPVGKKWKEEGEAAVNGILAEITANYTIRYETSAPIFNRAVRKLQVRLANSEQNKKLTIVTKPEIYVFCQK